MVRARAHVCVCCVCVYLLIDGDFEQLVILEWLGAEHQTVIVLREIARGGAIVVAEGHTVAASPVEHVGPRASPHLTVSVASRRPASRTPQSVDERTNVRARARAPPPPRRVIATHHRCYALLALHALDHVRLGGSCGRSKYERKGENRM